MRLIVFKNDEKDEKRECPTWKKPADWAFMEKSGEILNNLPNTWKQYPPTEAGMVGIIDMEYNEFKNTSTVDEMKQELVHLASACLHLWRKLSNVK